ncbi:Gfo/Idh/MocA family protein [Acuticoccus sp. I52.16.1]|uniref:Gfo/Idh/MocA family protein n=1 Tax=Acuticoccus sp. I52.16.1 TaxID=2928472 RepID=UPI001FD3DD33|nr:Gfo/Idh/MocA family oxidoreductase [Acuticoccus sp. I52.16.1]UOM33479.1 Gfo/Idh/MocA family oxidoreductase [Acuticoccus sp. I52.16.1]
MTPARLGVAGAGLIGSRHADAIAIAEGVVLTAIADPAEAIGRPVADKHGVPWTASLGELIARDDVDGIVLATPNQVHVEGGLACIAAGKPVLVEKPLASDLSEARRLVETAEAAGVPLAAGHHRRHNPLMDKAKELVDEGRLGTIASVQATTWFMKPDDYFETPWRRMKGAGPVYLNLAHDIDLLHMLVGPVVSVMAMESNAVRGNEVEETAVVLLKFASGTLGTVNICDTAVTPWSWELTASENPVYPATSEDCYWLAGTHASLAIPSLSLWTNPAKRSWWEPIAATRFPYPFADPLVVQMEQFGAVVRGEAPPKVTGRDGLAALEVIEAVKTSAATGAPVHLEGRG